MSNVTAEVVKFYLNRRIRELEALDQFPSMEEMAKRGVSYQERLRFLNTFESNRTNRADESSAMREALRVYEEYTTPKTG